MKNSAVLLLIIAICIFGSYELLDLVSSHSIELEDRYDDNIAFIDYNENGIDYIASSRIQVY
jgi:hypothetical protein